MAGSSTASQRSDGDDKLDVTNVQCQNGRAQSQYMLSYAVRAFECTVGTWSVVSQGRYRCSVRPVPTVAHFVVSVCSVTPPDLVDFYRLVSVFRFSISSKSRKSLGWAPTRVRGNRTTRSPNSSGSDIGPIFEVIFSRLGCTRGPNKTKYRKTMLKGSKTCYLCHSRH